MPCCCWCCLTMLDYAGVDGVGMLKCAKKRNCAKMRRVVVEVSCEIGRKKWSCIKVLDVERRN